MGDYTTLELRVRLKTPPDDLRKFLMSANEWYPYIANYDPLPDHPFFRKGRWTFILSSLGTSLVKPNGIFFEDHEGSYIERKCSLKNYEGEIESFLDWLSPLVSEPDGAEVGHFKLESYDVEYDVVFLDGRLQTRPREQQPAYGGFR